MAKGANQVSFMVAVIICLTISLRGSDALPSGIPDIFYEFGTAAGDTRFPPNDDGYTHVGLSSPFPFYGSVYNGMYVNNNGLLSFNVPVSSYSPDSFPIGYNKAMVAPFWADVDTRYNSGQVHYREAIDAETLGRISQDVRDTLAELSQFAATWAFVTTWHGVTYYGGGYYTSAGFNAGDGVNYFNIPGSRQPEIVDIETTSNVGLSGRWVFRIDQDMIVSATTTTTTEPTTTTTTTTTTSPPPAGYNCGDNSPCTDENFSDGLHYFPHEDDPGKFIQCGPENACYIMPCPGVQVWDPQILTCNLPPAATTTTSTTTTTTTPPPGNAIAGYNCGDNSPCTDENFSDGLHYFPHDDDPGKYILCGAGNTCYEMSCSGDLVWDSQINGCNWPRS